MKILNLLIITLFIFSVSCSGDEKPTPTIKKEIISSDNQKENAMPEQKMITKEKPIKDNPELEGIKKCDFKTGKITYNTTGFTTGGQVLYFDNWGFRNAIIQTIMINGVENKNKIITTEDWVYQMNLTENKFMKIPNLDNDMYKALYKRFKDNVKATDTLMASSGGIKIRSEKVLGKMCDVWQIETATTWLWKGIIVKSEMKLPMGSLLFEATEIKTDIDIPEDIFAIPTDVEFSEHNR